MRADLGERALHGQICGPGHQEADPDRGGGWSVWPAIWASGRSTLLTASRVCETQFRIVGISCELAVLANVTRRPTLAWPCLPDRTSVELDGDVAVSVCSDHPSGRDVVVRAENVCFVVGASHEQVIDCDVVDPRGPEANIFTGPMAKSAGPDRCTRHWCARCAPETPSAARCS